jgi:imidazole glycerol-phosphate synthase subunit HisF
MLKNRVIPSLLLKSGGLVKTTKFSRPMYVGDPINAIRIFNEKEVDELMVLDIIASKENREPDYNTIEMFASECFMPLCYGGGIKTKDQASRLFSLGVEKLAVQTSALSDLDLVSSIASRYGNQSVVVSIDIKKSFFGDYQMYSSAKLKVINQNWLSFLNQSVEAGAGEILLNAVDRDGTLSGMDLKLIGEASKKCPVPLIAAGGVGSLDDIKSAVHAGANAIAVGAFFVYHGPHRAVLISYPKYKELENLFKGI